jgi:hypothetical protein
MDHSCVLQLVTHTLNVPRQTVVDCGGGKKIHFTSVEKISRKKKCEENYYCMYVLKVLRVACMGVPAGLNCGCGQVWPGSKQSLTDYITSDLDF